MSQETQDLFLPYFGIQCDWEDEFRRTGGQVWISMRRPGQERSIHGDMKSVGTEADVHATYPFIATRYPDRRNVLQVKDRDSEFECGFVGSTAVYNHIHKKSVVSLDVTEGGLGVSVCQNNQLHIWETENGKIRRTLEGHVADVYSCRFFPSGVVLLSAGADMSIKIWSAETGDCPVTFRGHTGAVQDTCIVDRGKNVISISKDGTAKLWDCGESKCLDTLMSCPAVLNSCCLLTPSTMEVGKKHSMSEREVGTVGKVLLIAREDRKVQGINIAARKEIFNIDLPSAGNSVIATGTNSFAVGCQGGEIYTFDMRKLSLPRHIECATKTPVLSLMIHPRSPASKPGADESNQLFWAAKSDGTCVLINPNITQSPKRLIQLTGPDTDPIYQVKHDGNFIFTACRDGLIRKYSINHVMNAFQ